MEKDRLLAMTDGVVAIIITIMVLEFKTPHSAELAALLQSWPVFLAYVLSFVYVAIYWNNHHHYFQLVTRVNGALLWANLHLLFWLSLVPFATAWMGETGFASVPVALYGVALFMPAIAWRIMQGIIIRADGGRESSPLGVLLARDTKALISPFFYAAGVGLAFVAPWASMLCYLIVAAMWVVPDRRIEKMLEKR